MCLIIANIDGREIPEDFVTSAHRGNRDGFGVMWATSDGQLKLTRGLFERQRVLEIFKKLSSSSTPYVAHFRMATHGEVSASNCHPFPIANAFGGIGMVHNGCFRGREYYIDDIKSDTAVMAEKISAMLEQKHLHPADIFKKDVPELMRHYEDELYYNKVVFMNGDGDFNIINEDQGCWINGVWYSNEYSIGSRQAINKYQYRTVERVSVLHNKEALELVLANDLDEDSDFIDEADIEEIDESSFDVDLSPNAEENDGFDNSEDDDDMVLHPFATADGYSSSDADAKKFVFEGVEYDLTEEATYLSTQDIEELIQSAEQGETIAKAMVEDLVERCKQKNGTSTVVSSGFDDDDDDDSTWSQFINDYNKKNQNSTLLLPSSTDSEKDKDYDDTTAASYFGGSSGAYSSGYSSNHYSNSSYTRGAYGSYSGSETYTSYKSNDPIDQIVEALLKP